ncbi:MAG: peptide deformylase [Gammaproteobacteria bacterium]|nr:peptide deformylase [Gammaproteobacteria bacterium]
MTVQTVIRMGHPTLRRVAKPYPVDNIGSPAFQVLIQDMQETLHAYGGIGLAAPQIDVSYQVAVIEIENTTTRYGELERVPFSVFVNPVISVADGEITGYWEACLSIPGLMGYVERPQHIQIDYLDEAGTAQSLEYQGFMATVFQHEFDHLQGKLYVDRMKDPTQFAFDEEYHTYHVDE